MHDDYVEIDAGATIILLGRLASSRLRAAFPDRGDCQFILASLQSRPEAMLRLRQFWSRHHSRHALTGLSDHALLRQTRAAVETGQIQIMSLSRNRSSAEGGSVRAHRTGSSPPSKPAAGPVRDSPSARPAQLSGAGLPAAAPVAAVASWPMEDRIAEVIRRTAPRIPGGMRDALLSLLSAESLAIIAGTIALTAAANLTPYGWAADAVVLGIAYAFGGLAAIHALGDLAECLRITSAARSPADLDRAAEALARAVIGLGVVGLMAVLHRFGKRGGGGGNAEAVEESAADLKPRSRTPVERPTPRRTVPEKPKVISKDTPEAKSGRVLGNALSIEAANRAKALDFYVNRAGFSEERALQHIRGIDLSKDVIVDTLDHGTILQQYVRQTSVEVGNYFAPVGTTPAQAGLRVTNQVLKIFQSDRPVEVLKSIARPEFIYPPGEVVPGCGAGGGVQYFIPEKTSFIVMP